ncbi:hypothetical protein PROFUN_06236 [Planoprotostelium fungivorum]|uniref:Gamma-butyrobetaine dioxygenase n=1 Tax=Planoprotostelium fungivorum TaxID=1890364 RepID=A0A2P6NE37_9EUKA|nr:hypothetical protein PROFUN_06236 [Planoprotostelium fungivorum]
MNRRCPKCIHPSSGQKLYNPADISQDVSVSSIQQKEDKLEISWNDNHHSTFPLSWLRDHCYSKKNLIAKTDPKLKTWKNGLKIPTLPFEEVMNTPEGLREWLDELYTVGLVKITGCSVAPGTVERLARRISHPRETMYGTIFDVVSIPDAMNIAYTSTALDPHMDLLYYEAPPGLQFLHCLVSEAKGGLSTFMDAFQCADIMRTESPDLFNVITRVPTTYHKQGKDHSLSLQKTIVEVNDNGHIVGVNYSPQFGGVISVPEEEVLDYYRAVSAFTEITRRKEMELSFHLKPGEIITFNNRRVLHGRTSFDANSGGRHLQGIYVDLDEFYSKYRTFHRRETK